MEPSPDVTSTRFPRVKRTALVIFINVYFKTPAYSQVWRLGERCFWFDLSQKEQVTVWSDLSQLGDGRQPELPGLYALRSSITSTLAAYRLMKV